MSETIAEASALKPEGISHILTLKIAEECLERGNDHEAAIKAALFGPGLGG